MEQLKLYPAGGSRDYQYKQLCEQLATELEAVQKESMELLAEHAENAERQRDEARESRETFKALFEVEQLKTTERDHLIKVVDAANRLIKNPECECYPPSDTHGCRYCNAWTALEKALADHSLLPHAQAKKGTT